MRWGRGRCDGVVRWGGIPILCLILTVSFPVVALRGAWVELPLVDRRGAGCAFDMIRGRAYLSRASPSSWVERFSALIVGYGAQSLCQVRVRWWKSFLLVMAARINYEMFYGENERLLCTLCGTRMYVANHSVLFSITSSKV